MNLVLSGPSGAGKTTIFNNLRVYSNNFTKSVSYTTRKMRDNEVNGKDYCFVSKKIFLKLVKNNFFFEIAEYADNFYGIPNSNISTTVDDKDVFFDLIPSSGLNLKNHYNNTCLVYILPPDIDELNIRRGDRGNNRLDYDLRELQIAKNYDYLIVNESVDKSTQQLIDIIDVYKKNSISSNCQFLDGYAASKHRVRVR